MKESVFSIKNLRKEYICGRSWIQETETFAAVRNVSFELYQGETLGTGRRIRMREVNAGKNDRKISKAKCRRNLF